MKNKDKIQDTCAKKIPKCINALDGVYHTLTYFNVNKHDLKIVSKLIDRMQSMIVDMEDILSFTKKI